MTADMYLLGHRRCVWCGRPLTYGEMEVEHLIPRSLAGEALARTLELHGLPSDYDVEAVRNLAPSCSDCNDVKGKRLPPDAPIIAFVLDGASARAPAIEKRAKSRLTRRQVEEALAKLNNAIANEGDEQAKELLSDLTQRMASALGDAGPDPEAEVEVEFHPAIGLIWNPGSRWKLGEVLGPHAVVVTDGKQAGVVGTDITYMCGNCGSYGPWSGVRCLTCSHISDPWD